jgi:Plasmid replication region DNA-binding N-term
VSTPEDDLETGHGVETEGIVTPFARRAPRISQADVFRAADELLVAGHRPTIDRVRMRLGRGSPNTINDHLDAWWAKLGSRLRDVPGHEFPQLPERVGQALQHLWNEALDGARGVLQDTMLAREQAIAQCEHALDERTRHLTEREQATAARKGALEEALALARDQLAASNRQADALETALQKREAECIRLRSRIEALEESSAKILKRLDTATATHQAERVKLEERYASAEAHWLIEVDRARQLAKDAAKDHERQCKDFRDQIGTLQSDRGQLRQELREARSDLKTASIVREQLEARLLAIHSLPKRMSRSADRPMKRPRKPRGGVR